jgi:transcriptional regulator with XRE-family HTH domain
MTVSPTSQLQLCDRLRTLRVQQGLRQADLAGDALSVSYVSLIETGKRQPTARALRHLAHRLGTSPEYLRTGIENEQRQRWRLDLDYAELALANASAQEALDRFTELAAAPDAEVARRGQWGRARALEALGRLEDALALLHQLRRLALADPAQHALLPVVIAIARVSRDAGDIHYAATIAETTRDRAADLGLTDTDEYAELTATLLHCYYLSGDHLRATALATELIEHTEHAGSRRARAAAYWNAAGIAEARGRLGEAVALTDRAISCYAELDQPRHLARARVACAWFLLRTSPPQPRQALSLLEQALPVLTDLAGPLDLATAETETARARLRLGHPAEAERLARSAVRRLHHTPSVPGAEAHLLLAQIHLHHRDTDRASQELDRAQEHLQHCSPTRYSAIAWRDHAALHEQAGNTQAHLRSLTHALHHLGLRPTPHTPAPQPDADPPPPDATGDLKHDRPRPARTRGAP